MTDHPCDACPKPTGHVSSDEMLMKAHLERLGGWEGVITDAMRVDYERICATDTDDFVADPTEPLTVAVRVCADCKRLIEPDPIVEWRGKDANPGKAWTITHGQCDECLAKQEREMEEVA